MRLAVLLAAVLLAAALVYAQLRDINIQIEKPDISDEEVIGAPVRYSGGISRVIFLAASSFFLLLDVAVAFWRGLAETIGARRMTALLISSIVLMMVPVFLWMAATVAGAPNYGAALACSTQTVPLWLLGLPEGCS